MSFALSASHRVCPLGRPVALPPVAERAEYRAPKGTRDILVPDAARWRRFVSVFAEVVEAAGYGQVIPPMFEHVEVFHRVGETTDVVTKEMYAFEDRGGRL